MVTSFVLPIVIRRFCRTAPHARHRLPTWPYPYVLIPPSKLPAPVFSVCCHSSALGTSSVHQPSPASHSDPSSPPAPISSTITTPPNVQNDPMFQPTASFESLGASPATVAHLRAIGLTVPTTVQAMSIPLITQGLRRQVQYAIAIRNHQDALQQQEHQEHQEQQEHSQLDPADQQEIHRHRLHDTDPHPLAPHQSPEQPVLPPPNHDPHDVLMIGAETGSGKTLAYLLPYIEIVREFPDFPLKAVIMVPSRELCTQVSRQLRTYFPDAPSHIVLAGGLPPDAADIRTVRILIATPLALLNYFRFSTRPDANDKYIVVDEADLLLSGSFLKQVESVLDQPGIKPFPTRRNAVQRACNRNRLVFVGATYPHWAGDNVKSMVTWATQRYPALRMLQTQEIHKRSSKISESWHYLPDEKDRYAELVRVLHEDCTSADKVMVFCRQVDSATRLFERLMDDVGDSLKEKFGDVVDLHKGVSSVDRISNLERFREGEARVLICTDIAARGLDLGNVARIVEFEFSSNVVGYLHRIGRTARAGSSGFTNHFVDDVTRALADAIQDRSRRNEVVVEGVFSRDRLFRRKQRKRLKAELERNENQLSS